MGRVTRVQILDKALGNSLSANKLVRGAIGERFYSPANYDRVAGHTALFNLGMAIGLGEGSF